MTGVLHASQTKTVIIFEAKEEDRWKKRRKDFCVNLKKTERKKIHFQTAADKRNSFCCQTCGISPNSPGHSLFENICNQLK